MLSRREILVLCAMGVALYGPLALLPRMANATSRAAKKRLAELTGGVNAKRERVTITLPKVTDQGNFVPIKVAVDSSMTEDDYVKAIHVVCERNPVPDIASYYLNPDNGRAEITTRIRLVKSQVVVAAAEMGDGSVFVGKARCKISTGKVGCG
ncbi:MAG: thiosulfate oxidation carrier protein SoxY [Gammaproteobacteria bacterium]|nr:thiosulfate oxidation carrier protein SoxY [Gammaproteobacteria bacterium]